MPRFQLLIRESGKAPRVVPLTQPAVVGRSRRADIVIEDEEVGREQFRISVVGASVVIEGIGKTNLTTVDGATVEAGQRTTVVNGASIKVGRTMISVQDSAATEQAPGPGDLDATIVAKPAGAKAPPAPVPPAQEATSGYAGPRNTLDMPRPGAASPTTPPGAPVVPPVVPPAASNEDFGQTINVKGFRPGQAGASMPPSSRPATPPKPAAPPPTPAAANDEDFGQTINVKGFRPGQAGMSMPPSTGPAAKPPVQPPGQPPVPPPAPAASDEDFGQTINVKGFRPGQAGASMPPRSAPTPPPPAPAPAPTPAPPPPPKQTAPPAEPAAPSAPPKSQPKTTVYVDAGALAQSAGAGAAAASVPAADLEARLHQAMPRLFVKSEALRRRVRLMKPRNKVGRAETADVLLPNESVSELHAEIEFDGNTWMLRDRGSTNGTFVDGAVLRGGTQAIARNSLLGFGSLRGLFLCNDAARAAADQRLEERALKLLIAAGRLTREAGAQVRTIASRDRNQSLAEVLLHETALEPSDWANAIVAARQRLSLWERVRSMFRRRKPAAPAAPPTPPAPGAQGR